MANAFRWETWGNEEAVWEEAAWEGEAPSEPLHQATRDRSSRLGRSLALPPAGIFNRLYFVPTYNVATPNVSGLNQTFDKPAAVIRSASSCPQGNSPTLAGR